METSEIEDMLLGPFSNGAAGLGLDWGRGLPGPGIPPKSLSCGGKMIYSLSDVFA